MNPASSADPFLVLGLPRDAGEAEVRARYLALVKQFPPERDPEKFREIRTAFEASKDPLSIARRLTTPPDEVAPPWSQAIAEQKRNPPRLSPAFLLSLGNRAPGDDSAAPQTAASSESPGASSSQNQASPPAAS